MATNTDQKLSDAIDTLGKTTEKARRETSNVVAGKKRPEQAFAKWERSYCKPALELVHLSKHVRDDRTKHDKEYTEQLIELVRREEKIKLSEQLSSTTRAKLGRELSAAHLAFEEERDEWRTQRAQKLQGKELKAVQKLWQDQKAVQVEARIRRDMTAESDRAAEQRLGKELDARCAKARDQG